MASLGAEFKLSAINSPPSAIPKTLYAISAVTIQRTTEMTKEEVLKNIETKVSSSNKWYTSESTFYVTSIESWFNIQTIGQLPKEIKIPKYGTARILVNDKGIEMNSDFYSWEKILVTGYISRPKQLGKLVIGLDNGEIIEADGPSQWSMDIGELGHLVELYKIKHNKSKKVDLNEKDTN